MTTDPDRVKHLEMIQAIVTRMAGNSFLLKGWSVTIVAGLFALGGKDANATLVFLAIVPIVIFWGLDAYFLCQERCFRALYNKAGEDYRKLFPQRLSKDPQKVSEKPPNPEGITPVFSMKYTEA